MGCLDKVRWLELRGEKRFLDWVFPTRDLWQILSAVVNRSLSWMEPYFKLCWLGACLWLASQSSMSLVKLRLGILRQSILSDKIFVLLYLNFKASLFWVWLIESILRRISVEPPLRQEPRIISHGFLEQWGSNAVWG